MNFTNPKNLDFLLYKFEKFVILRNYYKNFTEFMEFKGDEKLLEMDCGIWALFFHMAEKLKSGRLYCQGTSKAMIEETKKNLSGFSNIEYINSMPT